jgi:hypothetical protein
VRVQLKELRGFFEDELSANAHELRVGDSATSLC